LESLKGRDHSEDLGVDGKIILKWIIGKMVEYLDWINLAQYSDQWWDVVNTRFHIASETGLYSVNLVRLLS
jgi:hypothetical protein